MRAIVTALAFLVVLAALAGAQERDGFAAELEAMRRARASYLPLVDGWSYTYQRGAETRVLVMRKQSGRWKDCYTLRRQVGDLVWDKVSVDFGFGKERVFAGSEALGPVIYETDRPRARTRRGVLLLGPGLSKTKRTFSKLFEAETRVLGFEALETPAGTFTCVKVDYGRGHVVWFAKGVGIVKSSKLGVLIRCEGPSPDVPARIDPSQAVDAPRVDPQHTALAKQLEGTWTRSPARASGAARLVISRAGCRITQVHARYTMHGTWQVREVTKAGAAVLWIEVETKDLSAFARYALTLRPDPGCPDRLLGSAGEVWVRVE